MNPNDESSPVPDDPSGDDAGAGSVPAEPASAPPRPPTTLERLCDQFVRRGRGAHRVAIVPTGSASSLRRMDVERHAPQTGDLLPVLIRAGITPRSDDEQVRWASVVQVVAILSGTDGASVYSDSRTAALGRRLVEAHFSPIRLAQLFGGHDETLRRDVSALARFLASRSFLPVDLRPLVELVLHDGLDEERAERARRHIARSYYTDR